MLFSKSSLIPANFIIYVPHVKTICFTSSGIFPFRHSIASLTSKVFPTAYPTGSSISVIIHTVSIPASLPISIISLESSSASFLFCIKAPLPQVTSNSNFLAPAAIFLLIILEAINGILFVQAIVSLKAYIFLSAGAKFKVCVIKLIPISFTFFLNSSMLIPVLYPGIDSNLSAVPPVNPNPLPDIFATGIPTEDNIGIKIKVILSPTPPVLCLSTVFEDISLKSNISPEFAIAIVKFTVSSLVIPFIHIAITNAAA